MFGWFRKQNSWATEPVKSWVYKLLEDSGSLMAYDGMSLMEIEDDLRYRFKNTIDPKLYKLANWPTVAMAISEKIKEKKMKNIPPHLRELKHNLTQFFSKEEDSYEVSKDE